MAWHGMAAPLSDRGPRRRSKVYGGQRTLLRRVERPWHDFVDRTSFSNSVKTGGRLRSPFRNTGQDTRSAHLLVVRVVKKCSLCHPLFVEPIFLRLSYYNNSDRCGAAVRFSVGQSTHVADHPWPLRQQRSILFVLRLLCGPIN